MARMPPVLGHNPRQCRALPPVMARMLPVLGHNPRQCRALPPVMARMPPVLGHNPRQCRALPPVMARMPPMSGHNHGQCRALPPVLAVCGARFLVSAPASQHEAASPPQAGIAPQGHGPRPWPRTTDHTGNQSRRFPLRPENKTLAAKQTRVRLPDDDVGALVAALVGSRVRRCQAWSGAGGRRPADRTHAAECRARGAAPSSRQRRSRRG